METSSRLSLYFFLGDLHHGQKQGTAYFSPQLGVSLGERVSPCAPGSLQQLCSLPCCDGKG